MVSMAISPVGPLAGDSNDLTLVNMCSTTSGLASFDACKQ